MPHVFLLKQKKTICVKILEYKKKSKAHKNPEKKLQKSQKTTNKKTTKC